MTTNTKAPATRKTKVVELTKVDDLKLKNQIASATIDEIKKAEEAYDKVADIAADILDAEIAKAEVKADKKAQALLAKEEKKAAKKAERAAKPKVVSAFGTAIDILCANPAITCKDLQAAVEKQTGLTGKDGAIRTAYSQANHIFKLLRNNKMMK